MASILIRNIEDSVKEKLRLRAAEHGRSMEEEVREMIRLAVKDEPQSSKGLGTRLHKRFAQLGGVELETPPRGSLMERSIFEE
jgi:plasmid stability protein